MNKAYSHNHFIQKNNQIAKHKKWKVYVSGFCDWPGTPEEAKNFNVWKCTENPSGRLFINNWHKEKSKPIISGALPNQLKKIQKTEQGNTIEWTFDLLPVSWGIANSIDTSSYNVIVNIGYGVYKFQNLIYLENNAINSRISSVGASGRIPGQSIDLSSRINGNSSTKIFQSPSNVKANLSKTVTKINKLDGRFYSVKLKEARQSNNYICNETHYLMLKKIEKNKNLRQAYFIHIPKPKSDGQYNLLATELSTIIKNLIQPVDM